MTTPNYWQQLTFTCSEDKAELISDWLEEHGALSVAMENTKQDLLFEEKIGSRPLWQQIKMTALFSEEYICEPVLKELSKTFPEIKNHTLEKLPEQNWMQQWLDQYQPIQISSRLWICPSWQTPPEQEAINIFLDPGMAFGTGTHPTTAMCLRWLDQCGKKGLSLLDYGCGSGILAIAGLKLGCSQAMGIDIDEKALEVTRENAQANQITLDRLHTFLPTQTPTNIHFDLIIANILANPLIELASVICHYAKSGTKIALSGLLKEQASRVIEAYAPFVNLQIKEQIEDWILLSGQFN